MLGLTDHLQLGQRLMLGVGGVQQAVDLTLAGAMGRRFLPHPAPFFIIR
ncbi:hypothetical protein ACIBEJ_51705 [Nonomuraea sp. NPDC050790]